MHSSEKKTSCVLQINVAANCYKDVLNFMMIIFSLPLCCCVSQIQKMGLQPSDISMFSSLMDLVKEARELAEQIQ